nr:MAG TPA: hypothetical protein [Caudoviricetes sp.]
MRRWGACKEAFFRQTLAGSCGRALSLYERYFFQLSHFFKDFHYSIFFKHTAKKGYLYERM